MNQATPYGMGYANKQKTCHPMGWGMVFASEQGGLGHPSPAQTHLTIGDNFFYIQSTYSNYGLFNGLWIIFLYTKSIYSSLNLGYGYFNYIGVIYLKGYG